MLAQSAIPLAIGTPETDHYGQARRNPRATADTGFEYSADGIRDSIRVFERKAAM